MHSVAELDFFCSNAVRNDGIMAAWCSRTMDAKAGVGTTGSVCVGGGQVLPRAGFTRMCAPGLETVLVPYPIRKYSITNANYSESIGSPKHQQV